MSAAASHPEDSSQHSVPVDGQDYLKPRPLYFGPEGRPLFGWLHPGGAGSLGMVICNPWGDESVRAHRSIRHLAIAASNVGVPTLRFDYDGTGDSAGHDLDPERLSHWLASIHAAADTLRHLSHVTRLCFAGVRLGATLAALAAEERTDVAGLVAIAPVLSGKSYVRELRLFQRAIDSKRNVAGAEVAGALESAGFLLGEQTQVSLATVDLLRAGKRPAPRVLILDRAEMPGAEKWAQRLSEWETRVDYTPIAGYAEMMLENHESIVPQEIIATAVTWVRELVTDEENADADGRPLAHAPAPQATGSATIAPSPLPDPTTEVAPRSPVQEHAVSFGDSNSLFGIVSVPQSRAACSKAIILLNSGAVPHVGPSRIHVTFARYLAELGYTVLRMDIASIGDSPPHAGQSEIDVYSPYALQDLAKAIEYLRRHWSVSEVSSAGICSGAYHSFKAAAAQFPLSQVILINPLTFFWKPGMSLQYPEYRVAQDIQRYRSSALSWSAWRKLVTGRVDVPNLVRVLLRGVRSRMLGPIRVCARLLGRPLTDDLPTELKSALKASIDVQFVFSAGDPGLQLLQTQGGAAVQSLRARERIGLALIEGANHTFTDFAKRRTLLQVLVGKLHGQAPASACNGGV